MRQVEAYLSRSPRPAFVLSMFLLVAAGLLHRFTGHRFNLDFFYVIPSAVAARFCGRRAALWVCALAACVWFLDDVWAPARVTWANAAYALANSALTFAILLAVALSVLRLHEAFEAERRTTKLKGEMISLVSHQFNNALGVMGTALVLLEDARGRTITEQDRELTGLIRRHLRTLKGAVQNFLNEARLASGRLALTPERIDAAAAARAAVAAMAPMASEKLLETEIDAANAVADVEADPSVLDLVLSNLISNAIKYTPEGGKISVRIADAPRAAGFIELSVRDTGIGMSKAEQGRVLDGFARTASARKAAAGFGIGLKLADKMLRAQGSGLRVVSAPGKGSTFSFLLRALPTQRPAA